MLTAIRQWVIKTMMKGQTGVVQTMPKQQIIEMNVQITAQRLMQNGINPNDLKTVGQVENVVNQIEQPKVKVNPGMTSVKKADVLDMEGNKIPEGSGIMAGKEIKNLSGELTSVPNKSGQSGLSYETKNKEAIQRLKDKKIQRESLEDFVDDAGGVNPDDPRGIDDFIPDPEEKAEGGRIGLLAGSVPKIPAVISALLKNKKKVNQAANNIFPTGDYKLDAEMVAESIVELNPKPFNNMLYDDLDDVTKSEIYGAALSEVSKKNALMLQMKKATKPEKTLQSMKEGKGINMSDPDIADEFARFMKETDPKGTKELEQKLQLENFKTKDRSENADGGRIGLFMGSAYPKGAAALREMLKLFGKKSDSVKNPSDILRIVNPKQFNKTLEDPSIYRKFDVEKGIGAPDMIRNIQKKMTSDRQSTVKEMLDAAKNIKKSDDATLKYKNEMIEEMMSKGADRKMAEEMAETISKMAENAAGKSNTPKLTDEGILQLENILKNMETGGKKPRDLNSDGGRIGLKAGMTKRAFLKLMGAGAAGVGAVKSGLFSIGKGATKQVAKEVAQQTTSTMPPPYFFKLAEKIKKMGDDVTPNYATKDREVVTKYKDFQLTEDIVTGRQEIQRMKTVDDVDAPSYYGNPLTEETYMSYTPGETIIGKGGKPVKTQPEYEEGTAYLRTDREFAGEVVDESATISDDILEEVGEAKSIKKASGGLAYMLGE